MLFECIREVNSDLSRVFEWFLANSLKLIPLKSMVLPIYRNCLLGPLSALNLGDDFIPCVFKAKNLGVTFSYDLMTFDSILGCFLLTYVEFWLACFMFSLLTGGRPRYLYDSLVVLRSERTLRINSPLRLDLYWPVKSGCKTRSQSQLGLCH
jgi:hypothetical protein